MQLWTLVVAVVRPWVKIYFQSLPVTMGGQSLDGLVAHSSIVEVCKLVPDVLVQLLVECMFACGHCGT